MTKIHILSDVHLEHQKGKTIHHFIEEADICVVAGDLNVGRTNTAKTLNTLAQHYKYVVYVLGNHEFYGGIGIKDFDYEHFGSQLASNVFWLNPGACILEGITFIGAPLYTNFNNDRIVKIAASRFINDFRRGKITVEDYVEQYNFNVEFIQGYDAFTEKKVIVTHWMPCIQLVHNKWKQDPTSRILNHYFANDLSAYVETLKNTTWIFGHTHDDIDAVIGTTRCIANPVGYPGEKVYTPKVIEL